MHQYQYERGTRIAGRYLIYKRLAGGMSEVYLCVDEETDRPFALKTFHERYGRDPRVHDAVAVEGAVWTALGRHPNVVQCYGVKVINNRPFLFLDWITSLEPGSIELRYWIQSKEKMGAKWTTEIALSLCNALVHAANQHTAFFHGDIKPENILIAHSGLITPAAIAKLTDFGLARVVQTARIEVTEDSMTLPNRQSLTRQGSIVGTPLYMAPEVWSDGERDGRTDIYAIGCTLYEILTGRPAFAGVGREDIRRLHLKSMPPTLSLSSAVPKTMSDLVSRCLSKRPEERFQTAIELREALQEIYEENWGPMSQFLDAHGNDISLDADMHSNRGAAFAEVGRTADALASFKKALASDPRCAPAYNNRGHLYISLGRYDDAERDFTTAIDIEPDEVLYFINRARVHQAQGDRDMAARDLQHVLSVDARNAEAYKGLAILWSTGHTQHDKVISYCDAAIQCAPQDADCYALRGQAKFQKGLDDEALEDCVRAIRLKPSSASAYYTASNIMVKRAWFVEALTLLKEADHWGHPHAAEFLDRLGRLVAQPPYSEPEGGSLSATSYVRQGALYESLGRYDEAIASTTEAIKRGPQEAAAWNNRGYAYSKIGEFSKALDDLNRAIELDPRDALFFINRGLVFDALGAYDDALKDHNHAIRLDAHDARAFNNRGKTHLMLDHAEFAQRDWERAVELNPRLAMGHANLGMLFAKRGEFESAEKHLVFGAALGDERCAMLLDNLRAYRSNEPRMFAFAEHFCDWHNESPLAKPKGSRE